MPIIKSKTASTAANAKAPPQAKRQTPQQGVKIQTIRPKTKMRKGQTKNQRRKPPPNGKQPQQEKVQPNKTAKK